MTLQWLTRALEEGAQRCLFLININRYSRSKVLVEHFPGKESPWRRYVLPVPESQLDQEDKANWIVCTPHQMGDPLEGWIQPSIFLRSSRKWGSLDWKKLCKKMQSVLPFDLPKILMTHTRQRPSKEAISIVCWGPCHLVSAGIRTPLYKSI